MPTVREAIAAARAQGRQDPEGYVASRLGQPSISPSMLDVDISALVPVVSNDLFGSAFMPALPSRPSVAAVAARAAPQPPQAAPTTPSRPAPWERGGERPAPSDAAMLALSGASIPDPAEVGKRTLNWAAGVPVSVASMAAGAGLGAASELARMGMEFVDPSVAMDAPEGEAPPGMREYLNYKQMIAERDKLNPAFSAVQSLADPFIGLGAIGAQLANMVPTGAESKPAYEQIVETARQRFAAGRQFGEGAVVGVPAQLAQIADEPGRTLANDWPMIALSAVPLARGAASLAKMARRIPDAPAVPPQMQEASNFGPVLPEAESSGFVPIDRERGVLAAAAADASAVIQEAENAGGFRQTPNVVREAYQRLQDATSRLSSVASPAMVGARGVAGDAANAAMRGGLGFGMGQAMGSPVAGAVLGGAAALGPLALRFAESRSPAVKSSVIRARQRFVDPVAAATPNQSEWLRGVTVAPQAARSGMEAAVRSGMKGALAESSILPGTETAMPLKYDIPVLNWNDELKEFGSQFDEGIADASAAALRANVEDVGNTGAAAVLKQALDREQEKVGRLSEQVPDGLQMSAIADEMNQLQANIDNAKSIASSAGKVESAAKRAAQMRGRREKLLAEPPALADQNVAAAREKLTAAQERSKATQADIDARAAAAEKVAIDERAKADAILAADPTADQKVKRGGRTTQAQKDWRAADKAANEAQSLVAGMAKARNATLAAADKQIQHWSDKMREAQETAAMRDAERLDRNAASIQKIEESLERLAEEQAQRLAQLPEGVAENPANFRAWLNEQYARRRQLRNAETVGPRLEAARAFASELEAKRQDVLDRIAENQKARQKGTLATGDESLSRISGSLKTGERDFVYRGRVVQRKEGEPATRIRLLASPRAKDAISHIHDKMNEALPIGMEPIPYTYVERLFADALLDDSPMLAGSKAMRGAVAKRVVAEVERQNGKPMPNRQAFEEAVNKQLDEVASSALRSGNEGARPIWPIVEADIASVNLREMAIQTIGEMRDRPNDKGGGSVSDVILKEAIDRTARQLGLKHEEAVTSRAIYNEATRDAPATQPDSYGKAAWALSNFRKGVRERMVIDFDPQEAVAKIVGAPLEFMRHAEELTGKKLEDPPEQFAGFVEHLKAFQAAPTEVAALLEKGKRDGLVPDAPLIWLHRDAALPLIEHVKVMQSYSDLHGIVSELAPIGRFVKGNLTYRSLPQHLGNIASNLATATMMTGQTPTNIVMDWKNTAKVWADWNNGKEIPGGQKVGMTFLPMDTIFRAIANTGVADTHAIVDLVKNMVAGDSSRGRVRSAIASADKVAQQLYVMGDTVPKVGTTMAGFAEIASSLDRLKDGKWATLDLGRDQAMSLTKRDGMLYDRDGNVVGGQRLADAIAKAAFQPAAKYLFDLNDLPLVPKAVGTNPLMSPFMPFLSWKWKATDVPGVKGGMMSALLAYDPSFIIATNDKALLAGRAAKFAKLSARRAALLGVLRSQFDFGDHMNMAASMEGGPMAPAVATFATESDLEDNTIPVFKAFSLGPTADAFRSGIGALASFMGPGWEGRLDPEAPPMTPDEKRRADASRRWYTDYSAGRIGKLQDFMEFIGLSGSFMGKAQEYALREERAGRPVDWSHVGMALLGSAVAGSVQDFGRVLASTSSEFSPLAGWRLGVNGAGDIQGAVDRGIAPEDWTRYMTRTMFGFGVQSIPGGIASINNVQRLSRGLSRAFVAERVKALQANLAKNLAWSDGEVTAKMMTPFVAASEAAVDRFGDEAMEGGAEAADALAGSLQGAASSLNPRAAAQLQEDIESIRRGARVMAEELQARYAVLTNRTRLTAETKVDASGRKYLDVARKPTRDYYRERAAKRRGRR